MNFFKRLRIEFKSLLTSQDQQKQQLNQITSNQNEQKQQLNQITSNQNEQKQQLNQITSNQNEQKQQLNQITSNQNEQKQQLLHQIISNHDELKLKFNYLLNKLEIISQTVNMHNRNVINNTKTVRIVFLIHNINAWYSIAELYFKMIKSTQFYVTVASINKNFPGQKGYSGEEKVHDFLELKNIRHIRLNMSNSFEALDILKSIAPDIILRQSQWDNDYPPAFSSEYINFSKLIFVSYEIFNLIQNVKANEIADTASDSFFHRRCWRIYIANEHIYNKMLKSNHFGNHSLRVTGHPKVDYIRNIKSNWIFNDKNKKRILWSPHHSITNTWSNFGCFHLIWRNMLSWFKNNPSIDFVFCPHPALITKLNGDNNIVSKEDVNHFFETINKLPNTYFYDSWDYMGIVKSVDVVITDGISMLIEPQIITKPIIFVERDDHVPFNENGSIFLSGLHRIPCNEIIKAQERCIELLNADDPLKIKQIKNVKKAFPKENAVESIIDDIKNLL